MEAKKSDVVLSLSGRDRGKLFLVVGVEDEYVFLADGKTRRIEKPKKKKRKHALFVCQSKTRAAVKLQNGEKVLNSEIRRALSEHLTVSNEAE